MCGAQCLIGRAVRLPSARRAHMRCRDRGCRGLMRDALRIDIPVQGGAQRGKFLGISAACMRGPAVMTLPKSVMALLTAQLQMFVDQKTLLAEYARQVVSHFRGLRVSRDRGHRGAQIVE